MNIPANNVGQKIQVPTSNWYPHDVGEILEKSAKSCKVKWPDGGIGLYDYDKNTFISVK